MVDVHGGEYFYEEATGRTSWNYEGMIMLYEKSQQPAVPPPRGKKNTVRALNVNQYLNKIDLGRGFKSSLLCRVSAVCSVQCAVCVLQNFFLQ